MAESYDIHLTDPLSVAFSIRAFTSNGTTFPTSSSLNDTASGANTSLLIFGKGHPNYGERTAENILQIMENFSGSSEPKNPVSGQLWYARYTLIQTGTGFYIWTDNPLDLSNGGTWAVFVPTAQAGAPGIVDGGYWHDNTANNQLYLGIDDGSHPLSPTWLLRIHEDLLTLGVPDPAVTRPRKVLKSFNGVAWVNVNAIATSDLAPTDAAEGDLWYDPAVSQLKVYTGVGFSSVTGDFLPLAGGEMTGDIIMGTGANFITGLADYVGSETGDYAANKKYVDDAIIAALLAVPIALEDLTNVNALPTINKFIKANGTTWEEATLVLADILDWPAAVTVSEVALLDGITGSTIQIQLDGKLSLGGGTLDAAAAIFVEGGSINLSPVSNELVTQAYVSQEVTASADGVLTSAAFTAGTMDLQLDTTIPTTINVDLSHTHLSSEVTHATTQPLLRDLLVSYPTVGLDETLEAIIGDLNERLAYHDSFAGQEIFTATTAQTDFVLTDGNYKVGSNRLSIFVNGLKQYADERAHQRIQMLTTKFLSAESPHGLGDGLYQLDVAVDGGAAQIFIYTVTNSTSTNTTIQTLINELNSNVTGMSAVWSRKDTAIYVFSDTAGTGSEINIIDSSLLLALAAVTGFELPIYTGGNVLPLGATYGIQEVDVGGAKTEASATGLLNTAQVYTATIAVDGGAPQAIAVTGSLAQTYSTLFDEIELDLTGATTSIVGGNLVITSDTTGVLSTIVIADTDLFSTLTGYIAINAAVDGVAGPIAKITTDRDYKETDDAFAQEEFQAVSSSVRFNSAFAGGEVVEIISEPAFFNM